MKLLRQALVAVSLSALTLSTTSVAFAKGAKNEANCEVKGKKEHVKDKAACEKKNGTWIAASTPAAAAPATKEGAVPTPAPTEEPKK
jgi:hypothetical protein